MDDFIPYITRKKAEVLRFPPPANDSGEILIAWQAAFKSLFEYTTALFEYTRTLEARIGSLETAVIETAKTVKRPVISSAGKHKGYLHSDGTVHPFPEDA
jgi:hypothetical protein